jgi:hypothetical protein
MFTPYYKICEYWVKNKLWVEYKSIVKLTSKTYTKTIARQLKWLWRGHGGQQRFLDFNWLAFYVALCLRTFEQNELSPRSSLVGELLSNLRCMPTVLNWLGISVALRLNNRCDLFPCFQIHNYFYFSFQLLLGTMHCCPFNLLFIVA